MSGCSGAGALPAYPPSPHPYPRRSAAQSVSGLGPGQLWLLFDIAGGLGRFRRRSHIGIPIKQPAATVAGQQLALAKLVPHLRTNPHPAAVALLILSTRQAGATRRRKPIEARQPFRLDGGAKHLALRIQAGQLCVELLLPAIGAFPRLIKSAREHFNLRSRPRQTRFQSFCPFQAGELLVLQPIRFAGGELNLMLNRLRLLWSLHIVQLLAEA